MRTPAALVAVPLLVGTSAGLVLSDRTGDAFALTAAAAALLALMSCAVSIDFELRAEVVAALATGCLLSGASLGAAAAARAYQAPIVAWFASHDTPAPVILEGVLREDAAITPFGASLFVDVVRIGDLTANSKQPEKPLGGVRLSIAGILAASRAGEWRAGRRVRVSASLRRPAFYLDPGVRDERRALARRGIALVGSVKSAALVEVLAHGSRINEAAASIRAWTRARLLQSIGRWRQRSAAVAAAILVGDRTGLTETDTRRLQQAGTYHVIAISGGNIAILTMLLLMVMEGVRLRQDVAAALAIGCLIAYGRITVSAPSVDRAIAASVIYLAARVMDHRAASLNVLAIAAVVGVALSPVTLFDPGFVLSFGATLGILIAMNRMPLPAAGRRSAVRAVTRTLLMLLFTTVAAEIALTPMTAVFFSRVTFAGLLFNFVAIPLMSILQSASLAALAVAHVDRAAAVFGLVAHRAADGLIESASLVEIVPWLVREVTVPPWWLIAVYYAAVTSALIATRRRSIRIAAGLAALSGAVIVTGIDRPPAAASLRIVFLDVGQGDATAVLLPHGRALLVDAGGLPAAQSPEPDGEGASAFDVGERVVAPALRALGVRRLDVLVVTHGDPDHIGGAPAIIRAFRPRSLWEGIPVPPHPALRGLIRGAGDMGAVRRQVQREDVERIGDVELRVLHPARPEWERQRVRNEDSIVLDIRVGDVSVILPGDVGREGELALLPLLARSPVVVLKAPHHGSASSSTPELLAALRPAGVVFSAGRNNRFGHPHPAVVARYRASGAQLFSTAEDGAVVLATDGKTVLLRGWTGRSVVLPHSSF